MSRVQRTRSGPGRKLFRTGTHHNHSCVSTGIHRDWNLVGPGNCSRQLYGIRVMSDFSQVHMKTTSMDEKPSGSASLAERLLSSYVVIEFTLRRNIRRGQNDDRDPAHVAAQTRHLSGVLRSCNLPLRRFNTCREARRIHQHSGSARQRRNANVHCPQTPRETAIRPAARTITTKTTAQPVLTLHSRRQ